MYLTDLHIENNGPLRRLHLEMPFFADGAPKPVVLVGSNGSGKTNLISCIADALFEAAAQHYRDIVPDGPVGLRPWFRIAGASTISVGASGSLTLMRFEHDGTEYRFREKAGTIDSTVSASVSPRLLSAYSMSWPEIDVVKNFEIEEKPAKDIFNNGVYVYFPSSRAEAPNWLNRQSVRDTGFDLEPRFNGSLGKPIYVERGVEPLKQWLLSLLLDARADIEMSASAINGSRLFFYPGDQNRAIENKKTWHLVNTVIGKILADPEAYLVWLGRHGAGGLSIQSRGKLLMPNLDALSAGQALLLNMFGTLIRYADYAARKPVISPDNIVGMCLIDEIDAHMHIDLQHRVLPDLIKLFPRVQFVLSTHSPLFVLGMERAFEVDGFKVIDLPSGTPIDAESYAEFGHALDVVRETKAFTRAIAETVARPGKMLVLVEGETDPIYYSTAAKMLGHAELLDRVEIDWVGAKEPRGGQGFNTGANGLKATYNAMRANPAMIARPLLLVYDNDMNVPASDDRKLFARRVPGEANNSKIRAGIESLLPEEVFIPEMYIQRTKNDDNGNETTTRSLNKMQLCRYVCEERQAAEDFVGFVELLDMIDEVWASVQIESSARVKVSALC